MECLKFDEKKIDFTESATWNVWYQFGIDINQDQIIPLKVDEHYMPTEEQEKLLDYMISNYKKLKHYGKRKKNIVRLSAYERLAYFPAETRTEKVKNRLTFEGEKK